MEEYPTYNEYRSQIDAMVSRAELTAEQGIILIQCFKATLNNLPVHINYLMACTGSDWQRLNWTVNGLVCRGAIRKIEDKFYMV